VIIMLKTFHLKHKFVNTSFNKFSTVKIARENPNFIRDYKIQGYSRDQIDHIHLYAKSFLKNDFRSFQNTQGFWKVSNLVKEINTIDFVKPKLSEDLFKQILKSSIEPGCLFEFRNADDSEVRWKPLPSNTSK